jgi:protocatechuate 3,4-dioxygenase beta subunit
VIIRQQVLALVLLLTQQIGMPPRAGDSLSGLIVGQVVDGESGRPVTGAIVGLNGPVGASGAAHPRILTGSDGRFVYRGLRRGSYSIFSSKPGYVEGAQGRTRPAGPTLPLQLADGERNGDAIIRMWKHASISGTVVDEAGERLVGVRVQAYRRTVISGRRRYVPAGSALTDDRGIYRVSALIPGDYIVGAVARQTVVPLSMATEIGLVTTAGTTASTIGAQRTSPGSMLQVRDAGLMLGGGAPVPPPVENGRLATYPPTFHPNAPSGDSATVIPLRAGAEYLSADLQLKPVSAVTISGYVVGPEGAVTMTPLRLIAANTIDISLDNDATSTMTDRSGRFTFPAVPSGHYNLRLQRGAPRPGEWMEPSTLVWTDVPLSVGNEDIDNLVVEAQPGVRIGGRIEFDGKTPPPFKTASVTIEPADPVSANLGGTVIRARINDAGEFESPPLPGGRYYVRVQNSPSGWMFKSATADGHDVVDTPMNIAADTLNVVVTFTDRWSGIRGIVQNRQGADAAAAVLVFPTDSEAWGSSGVSPRRVRLIRPGNTGEYSVNLPSGEYYVIAVPDAQTADWQDPAFLDSASRAAVRVTIAEGERKSQDLRTREMR